MRPTALQGADASGAWVPSCWRTCRLCPGQRGVKKRPRDRSCTDFIPLRSSHLHPAAPHTLGLQGTHTWPDIQGLHTWTWLFYHHHAPWEGHRGACGSTSQGQRLRFRPVPAPGTVVKGLEAHLTRDHPPQLAQDHSAQGGRGGGRPRL